MASRVIGPPPGLAEYFARIQSIPHLERPMITRPHGTRDSTSGM